jgi:deoxycytidylate deaminase
MIKPKDPRDLAIALMSRSIASVQVAAVLADRWGIHSWGWNSAGPTGLGIHAEHHCLIRANRSRLAGSTLYVAAQRKRNGKPITAKPCEKCQLLIGGIEKIMWRENDSFWYRL